MGMNLVMWMPEEGLKDFKTLLMLKFRHFCLYLGRASVIYPQFTCRHIKLYEVCVRAEVKYIQL